MRLSAFFFEIIPISGFFIGSQYFNLILAAFISLILSLVVIITFYILEKRVSKFQIFSISMSTLLTSAAYLLDNENFIKSMRQVDQSTRNAEVIEVMGMKKNIISSCSKSR